MRTDEKSNEDFESEPRVADRFHVEEGHVWLTRLVDQLPVGPITQLECVVGDDLDSEIGMSFEAERKNGDDDEENGHE